MTHQVAVAQAAPHQACFASLAFHVLHIQDAPDAMVQLQPSRKLWCISILDATMVHKIFKHASLRVVQLRLNHLVERVTPDELPTKQTLQEPGVIICCGVESSAAALDVVMTSYRR